MHATELTTADVLIERKMAEAKTFSDPWCVVYVRDGQSPGVTILRGAREKQIVAQVRELGAGRMYVLKGAPRLWRYPETERVTADRLRTDPYWSCRIDCGAYVPETPTPESIADEITEEVDWHRPDVAELEAGIAQAIHDEREACARLVEAAIPSQEGIDTPTYAVIALRGVARDIRSRPGGD